MLSGPGKRPAVLVVEAPELQRLYRVILEGHGYEVISADVQAGLDLLLRRPRPVHLLITNSPEPFVPYTPELRILYVSGSLPEGAVYRGADGAVRTLAKPFSNRVLLESVQELLGG